MVSKRARMPASERLRSAVRRDDEVTIAIGQSAAASPSSSSSVPGLSGRPAAIHLVAIGEEGAVDFGERKVFAIAIEQHGLAGRPGKADHGVAERLGIIGIAAGVERRDEAVEIDLFGVEQRAVHVEQDGADVPFRCHVALARGAVPRACAGNPGRGNRCRPSASACGTPRPMHQHGPDRLQPNSVPQPAQARRREASIFERFVINGPHPDTELIPGSSRDGLYFRQRSYARRSTQGKSDGPRFASRARRAQSLRTSARAAALPAISSMRPPIRAASSRRN